MIICLDLLSTQSVCLCTHELKEQLAADMDNIHASSSILYIIVDGKLYSRRVRDLHSTTAKSISTSVLLS